MFRFLQLSATTESLNLIKRISVVNVIDEQFLSKLKDNVTPVVTPVRKIPLALKPKLEKELKRMVDLDIIKPVQKPTGLVNGLVVVET